MRFELQFITFLLQFFLAQMSSLSMSSSSIHSSTFSNQIYLSVDIILVYLKFVGHQGSALSPPLSWMLSPSEARSDIPSELLYDDDLVLMVMVGRQ